MKEHNKNGGVVVCSCYYEVQNSESGFGFSKVFQNSVMFVQNSMESSFSKKINVHICVTI